MFPSSIVAEACCGLEGRESAPHRGGPDGVELYPLQSCDRALQHALELASLPAEQLGRDQAHEVPEPGAAAESHQFQLEFNVKRQFFSSAGEGGLEEKKEKEKRKKRGETCFLCMMLCNQSFGHMSQR